MAGWIKQHRTVLDNPVICKDAEYFAIWSYLLLSATHSKMDVEFKGEKRKLKPGQFITGRKKIAQKFNISESKVQRVLKRYEIEQQIKQETSSRNRLITVVNWLEYQAPEQLSEQPVNNQRTTSEQPVDTNKNVKKVKEGKNDNKDIIYIVEHLNLICKTKYKSTTPKTQTLIKARLGEGFTVDDFKTVIDKKYTSWNDTNMDKYLRPETLFGTKFEGYLNELVEEEWHYIPKAEREKNENITI